MSSNDHKKPLLSAWRFGLWLVAVLVCVAVIAILIDVASQPVSVIVPPSQVVATPQPPAPTIQPSPSPQPTATPAPTATPDNRVAIVDQRVATVEAHGQQVAVTVEALARTAVTHTAEIDHIFNVFEWVGWAGLVAVAVISAVLATSQIVRPTTSRPVAPQPALVAPSVADEFMAAGARRAVLRPRPAPISEDERRARILARILVENDLLRLPTQTAMLRAAWPHLNPNRPMPVQLNAGVYNRMINRAIEIANSSTTTTISSSSSSSRLGDGKWV